MRTLGVVLAGGRSRRFGSDKAEASLFGRSLLEHVLEALKPQCDTVAVVGRQTNLALAIADWPRPDEGPLGGLAGALRYAAGKFEQVLSVPVDCPFFPTDLRVSLEPGPSVVAGQPTIGLWPVGTAPLVEALLLRSGKHSIRALMVAAAAHEIAVGPPTANINTPQDLAALENHVARPPMGTR